MHPSGTKYDSFYATAQEKEDLPTYPKPRWPRNRLEAIVAHGGCGSTILDVGCGNGLLLYQFRDSFETLVGLEYSGHRLSQAKINLEGYDFIPIQGSAECISSLQSNSIDRVVSADTIEHVQDVYAATEEIFRVLKPGGVLVINTPNVAFIKKRLLLFLGRFPSTSQPNEGIGNELLFDGGHLHYFTFRSLGRVLEKAGFQLIRRVGYGRYGSIHNFYAPLLSVGVQWVSRKPV